MSATIYNNDRAYANSWLVYINGLEIPATAVSVSYGVWQIPEAQIQLAPDPILYRLGAEDRVMAQVFYCDQWYYQPPQFCLLFDGEITAWGFVGTTGSRSLSFVCIDYTAILTQLFFFFMSSFDDVAIGTSGQQIGVSGTQIQTDGFGALYPYSLFSQGVADPGDSASNNSTISRPIDFVYNVVRSLIKAQHPNRTVPAANFFTPWTKRTNFHRRWIALPYLDADPGGNPNVGVFPILRAVQAEKALSAVARMASSVGSSGSIWDMLGEILKTMMMEIAMIPTAAAVRSDFATLLPKGPIEEAHGPTFLTNYFVKPQMFFGLPPVCNVFFPSQIQAYAYDENYITQPTRMYFNEEAILGYLNQNGTNVQQGLAQMMQDYLSTGYPEEVDIAARDATDARGQNGKNLLVYPEEFFKGPVIDRRAMPRWFVFLQQAIQTQGNPGTETPTTNEVTADDGDSGPGFEVRAITTADTNSGAQSAFYIGQPGSANANRVGQAVTPVQWPLPVNVGRGHGGQYGEFLFGQPRSGGTRLHKGHDISAPAGTPIYAVCRGTVVKLYGPGQPDTGTEEGNAVCIRDEKQALHYYMHMRDAPMVARGEFVEAGKQLGVVGSTGRSGGPHLHYQCITATNHALNYTDLFRELRTGRRTPPTTSAQQATPAGTPPSEAANVPGRVIDPQVSELSAGDTTRALFRTYAMYEYYRERYARRRGSVTLAGFNPYPVPGFPCAVFDRRSSSLDTVGYIMSVQHQLSTQGWATNIAYTYGRTFQEMFALMQRTAALDSARLGLQSAAITQAVQARSADPSQPSNISSLSEATSTPTAGAEVAGQNADNVLAAIALPAGAIAMAPAEPLEEIQGVIQNFTAADEFYKAVFFHGRAAASDALAAENYVNAQRPSDDVYVPYTSAQAIADAQLSGAPPEVLASMTLDAVQAQESEQPRPNQPAVAPRRLREKAVFYYPDIIDMMLPNGQREAISIEGVDGHTRSRMLIAIREIRAGSISQADLEFFYNTTGQQITPPAQGAALEPELDHYLKGLEVELRTQSPRTNVRGDIRIVPRRGAEPLFSSYTAAMGYNSRPICTLDEYISFLGEDGLREGKVTPTQTSQHRDSRQHPAPFYTRIRRLRSGPPTTRPIANITNTPVTTDGAAGNVSAPAPEMSLTPLSSTTLQDYLTALDPSLASAGSAILDELRNAGLLDHSIEGVNLQTLSEEIAQANYNRAISPETFARLNVVLEQAAGRTGGTTPAQTASGGSGPDSTPTVDAATPPPQDGVYAVEGIPLDFPDTRANWDTLLEQYRYNVLTRKAPMA